MKTLRSHALPGIEPRGRRRSPLPALARKDEATKRPAARGVRAAAGQPAAIREMI
jgi:hypothetical protein